jgi:protein-tyrosine phosphatase
MDQIDRVIAEESQHELDANWITDRIALGGWVEKPEKMKDAAQSGITHILNMAWEFDETPLAEPYGIQVFSNMVDDDFAPKPAEVLERGVEFALSTLEQPDSKLLIHCVAGRHRGPMMTLAVLCVMGWPMEEAMRHIAACRPVVDWAPVYVESVSKFLQHYFSNVATPGSSREAGRPGLVTNIRTSALTTTQE